MCVSPHAQWADRTYRGRMQIRHGSPWFQWSGWLVTALLFEQMAATALGQCRTGGEKVCGLSVHTAARVMAIADPGEVLLSAALRTALAGTTIPLTARGQHVLKGVPGEWPLYAVNMP